MLTLMVGWLRTAPSNILPSSWWAVFVTWDDMCDRAWAGVGARAGAATLAGDGALAGVGARGGVATLAGDWAWAAGAGSAGLQYLNRLCCARGLVTGGGEGGIPIYNHDLQNTI